MPELPEVTTIVNDLKTHIINKQISKVIIAQQYEVFPKNNLFVNTVTNAKILNVRRIAKNIVIEIEKDSKASYIVIHLAMTGRITLQQTSPTHRHQLKIQIPKQWIKVTFELTPQTTTNKETAGKTFASDILHFSDVRMFGKVKLLSPNHLEQLERKYGIEPISTKANADIFYEAIVSKRTSIKNVLLDQEIISGLGNIYATDALFLAKLHPETPTKNISRQLALKLFEAAKTILNEGILHRGSTLPDKMYVDIFGNAGTQQNFFRIYMKQKCPECGTKVEVIKINGRGTYYCPKCQIKPDNVYGSLFD